MTQHLNLLLRSEWPLLINIATAALFLLFSQDWLADLSSSIWLGFILAWLFTVILLSAFAVLRHASGAKPLPCYDQPAGKPRPWSSDVGADGPRQELVS